MLRDTIGRSVLVIALFAAATASWRQSQATASAAADRERWLTLQASGEQTPAAAYWRGRYDEVRRDAGAQSGDDPAALLIAANAAFRSAERQGLAGPGSSLALEGVLQAYATALKTGGFDADAAYNFEYVSRLRDTIARQKPPARGEGPTTAKTPPSRPAGTIHGVPGAHPGQTKGEEFEVITPMEYGEREAQPEPTPGVKPVRKG